MAQIPFEAPDVMAFTKSVSLGLPGVSLSRTEMNASSPAFIVAASSFAVGLPPLPPPIGCDNCKLMRMIIRSRSCRVKHGEFRSSEFLVQSKITYTVAFIHLQDWLGREHQQLAEE